MPGTLLMKQLHDLTANLSGAPSSNQPPLTLPLYYGNHLAVLAVYQTSKSTTSSHIHIGKHEWIGVIYGEVKVVFEDDNSEVIIHEFDTCHIGPDRPHYIVALKDSLTWAVTIPPDNHYPSLQEHRSQPDVL